MPSKYPPAVDEAIWTLRTTRPKPLPHNEIRRLLAEGNAGLETRYEIPKGTYWDKLRKLREARGHEDDYVPETGEVDAIDEIARRNIGALSARARNLRKTAPQSDKDALALAKITRELVTIKRTMREDSPHSPRGRKGQRAKQENAATRPESLLDQLASQEPASG